MLLGIPILFVLVVIDISVILLRDLAISANIVLEKIPDRRAPRIPENFLFAGAREGVFLPPARPAGTAFACQSRACLGHDRGASKADSGVIALRFARVRNRFAGA